MTGPTGPTQYAFLASTRYRIGEGVGVPDGNRYIAPSGPSEANIDSNDEAANQMIMPVACYPSSMRVATSHQNNWPMQGGESYVITLRNGAADTALTCTMTGSDTGCAVTAAAAQLMPGDLVAIEIDENIDNSGSNSSKQRARFLVSWVCDSQGATGP